LRKREYRAAECRQTEHGRDGQREAGAHLVRCDRTMFLDGMTPVLFAIGDVVHEVDGARQRAEEDEHDRRAQHGVGIVEPLRKHQGRKDEEVLRPLTRAQRYQETEERQATAPTTRHLSGSGRTYSPPAPANFLC
jgi:hypothetical protein